MKKGGIFFSILIIFIAIFGFFAPTKPVSAGIITDLIQSNCEPGCTCCPGDRMVNLCDRCVPISEFCGNDPIILYDAKNKECYCPSGYDDKDNNNKCVLIKEGINLKVEVISDDEPPLYADGIKQATFEITATYKHNGELPPIRVSLSPNASHAQGSIDSPDYSRVTNGYAKVTYTTPYLVGQKELLTADLKDILVISYQKFNPRPVLNPEWINIEYEVPLTIGVEEGITISHAGFANKKYPMKFGEYSVGVLVYTINQGKEVPVRDAQILNSRGDPFFTDNNGYTIIEHPQGAREVDPETIKIKIELDEFYQNMVDSALEKYDLIPEGDQRIKKFLTQYKRLLAEETDEEEKSLLLSGLKATEYALFFVSEGEKFKKDIEDETAGIITGLTKQLVSFIWSKTKLNGIVKEKYDKLRSEQILNLSPGELNKIDDFLLKTPESLFRGAWEKMGAAFYKEQPDVNPGIFFILEDKIFSDLGSWTDGKVQEYTTGKAMENIVKYAMEKSYADDRKKMLDIIGQTVEEGSFIDDPTYQEQSIKISKEAYKNYTENHLRKKEISYDKAIISSISTESKNIANTTAKVITTATAPQFYGLVDEICDITDKAQQGIDTALNVREIMMWADAYGYNLHTAKQAVYNITGYAYDLGSDEQGWQNYLGNPVYAQIEENILVRMYKNNVPKDHPDRIVAVNYYSYLIDKEIYSELKEVIEIVAEALPDDPKVQKTKESIEKIYNEAATYLENNRKKVEKMEILDEDYSPYKKKKPGFKFDFKKIKDILIVIAVIIGIILLFKVKLLRKALKWLIIGGIIIFIIGAIFLSSMNEVPDGDKDKKDLQDNDNNLTPGRGTGSVSVKASSVLPPGEGYVYDARLAQDGDNKTAWVEGKADAGIGEWIKFDFAEKKTISTVDIVPGYASSRDVYFKNNRVKRLKLEFSDGQSHSFTLPDEMKVERLGFEPIETDYVKVTILEVYAGSKYNDTAIAEVSFK